MPRPQIWAPSADIVELEVDGRRVRTRPDPDRGGWHGAADLPHGTDYRIVLDGDPLPDPRARWAPHGVHGPSRALDPSTFVWRDAAWPGAPLGPSSLIYELHVGTFTAEGTLRAAADRLGHLADLGVSHVELLPLAAFDGDRGWGYDGVLLDAVHETYGGPAALAHFVDMAHRTGIAVILDVVHNHLGPSGNYWDRFGPLFTDLHHTPWGRAVNLDAPGSDDVRHILLDSARTWLRDYHLDGLRLDAVHELHDDRAVTFLEELATAVDDLAEDLGRPLTLIAESDRNDPRTVTSRPHGGLGLAAQWDDDIHHALHWLLTGETDGYYADFANADAVASALTRTFLHDGRWSSFRGRSHGRPVDPAVTPPSRFVVALQTHDQVGNRARGERLADLISHDRLAAGAALLFALPYVPMLFMGEEWAARTPWLFFAGFDDPELASAVTEGRQREFAQHGWDGEVPDPQDPATFSSSVLDWSELDDLGSRRMLSWYRRLAALRRTAPPEAPASVGWESATSGPPTSWWVLTGQTLTAVNLDPGTSLALDVEPATGHQLSVLTSWRDEHRLVARDGTAAARTVVVPPGGTVVVGGAGHVVAGYRPDEVDLRDARDVRAVPPAIPSQSPADQKAQVAHVNRCSNSAFTSAPSRTA